MAAALQGPSPGEFRQRDGQLALQPLLLGAESLDRSRTLGVLPAISRGQDQASEPATGVPPGSDGLLGGRIAPGEFESGLAISEDSRHGGLAAPDAPVSRVVPGGQM